MRKNLPGYLERTSVMGFWERLAAAVVLVRGCKTLPQVPFALLALIG